MIGRGRRGPDGPPRTEATPQDVVVPPQALPRAPAAVAADLSAARRQLADCEVDVAANAAAYERALDVGRDAALEARQHLTEAEVDRDVARRAVERFEAEHTAALDAARRAEVERLVVAADTAIGAYRTAVEDLLPEMGRAARELARLWAEASIANEAAEDGMQASLRAEGIERAGRCRPGVEDFRTWPGRPRVVVGEAVERTLWVNGAGRAVGDEWQDRIRRQPDGSGVLFGSGARTEFDHRRTFREEQVLRKEPARAAAALLAALVVPGVTAADRDGWSPPLGRNGVALEPSRVLAHLVELERPSPLLEDRREPVPEVNPTEPAVMVRGQVAPVRPVSGPWGSAEAGETAA